jgi:hypothetical protein
MPPRGPELYGEGGMALPVRYDAEALAVLSLKLRQLRRFTALPLLLETQALLTPLPQMELDEPSCLNTLHRRGDCGVLLDLHNFWQAHPWPYHYGYLESERFCHWLEPFATACHAPAELAQSWQAERRALRGRVSHVLADSGIPVPQDLLVC